MVLEKKTKFIRLCTKFYVKVTTILRSKLAEIGLNFLNLLENSARSKG